MLELSVKPKKKKEKPATLLERLEAKKQEIMDKIEAEAKNKEQEEAEAIDGIERLPAAITDDAMAQPNVLVPGNDGQASYATNPFSQAQSRSSLAELAAQVMQEKHIGDQLLDVDDIELKTRLSAPLTVQCATAILVAQQHNLPEFAAFVYKLMELRVSLLGEGRKEVVEVAKGNSQGMHPDTVARMRG